MGIFIKMINSLVLIDYCLFFNLSPLTKLDKVVFCLQEFVYYQHKSKTCTQLWMKLGYDPRMY